MTIEETMAAANKVAAINVLTGIFNIVNQWDEQQREIERLREEIDDLKAENGGARRPGPVERAIRDEFSKPRHGKFWTAASIDPWFDRTRERLGIEHDPDQCHLVDLIAALLDELDDPKTKAEEPREVTEDDLPEELRKRLMPEGMEWPKWDDGTPVLTHPPLCVRDEDGTLRDFIRIVYDGGLWFLLDRNDTPFCIGASGARLKRPAPIAHDGKPIRRGDTVHGRSDGKEWRVIGFNQDNAAYPVRAVDEDRTVRDLKPEWLTHERPSNGDAKPPETAGNPSRNGDGCPKSDADGGFATETSRESDIGRERPEDGADEDANEDSVSNASSDVLNEGDSWKKLEDDLRWRTFGRLRETELLSFVQRAKKLAGVGA